MKSERKVRAVFFMSEDTFDKFHDAKNVMRKLCGLAAHPSNSDVIEWLLLSAPLEDLKNATGLGKREHVGSAAECEAVPPRTEKVSRQRMRRVRRQAKA